MLSHIKKRILSLIKVIKPLNHYQYTIGILLILMSISLHSFISNNENHYNQPIAKITSVIIDTDGLSHHFIKEDIEAIILNGKHKGTVIHLQNNVHYSEAYNAPFTIGDKVFITIRQNEFNEIHYTYIREFKRDEYLGYIIILFVLLTLFVAGSKGARSLAMMLFNVLIFYNIIRFFVRGYNLIPITLIASILFIVVSISMVNGFNKKSASAILGSLFTSLMTLLITLFVLSLTGAKGIYFEEMEFLIHSPEAIFYSGILIGTLGGIMDIAITIASSIAELLAQNPNIENKTLIHSGRAIGKDIMGTTANTLALAYLSGSIPIILLWLKNGVSLSYILRIGINLEIIRALIGSIGIVLSIPITLFASIILMKNVKIGGTVK
ncbi:putative membrane protein [Natranaerovirga pectinivora]|uniref:Putative membrane protein n=1 Tax=Natranaerovirga pectinivora TaxID=682400 RepID=A0A4R3MJ08_9FIRM|nr:YibE/F family protein [Natranaerovirga pectinivora]TCT13870.1 putative membrane protein [Natranaerovirga pectinivora]